MTSISDLREGDEIDVVLRMRVESGTLAPLIAVAKGSDHSLRLSLSNLFSLVESVTVVRPEIIPGRPYVDPDGLLYIGHRDGKLFRVDEASIISWYGPEEANPVPAGLRPAKVVPEP